MGRTTPPQRGASRSTKPTTAKRGGGARSSSTPRTGAKRAASGPRKSPSRSRAAVTKRRNVALRPAGPWVPAIAVAIVVLLGWSLYPALRMQYQSARRSAGLEQQYDALRKRNQTLSAEVADLKTPAGVEKAAREKLGYTKRGENVYVVIPDGSDAVSGAATASVMGAAERSLVQTVLDAVFGVSEPASPGLEP